MNKFINWFFLIFLLFFCSCSNRTNNSDFAIEGLGKEYGLKDEIIFNIKNDSNIDVNYLIIAEFFAGSKWVECGPSILAKHVTKVSEGVEVKSKSIKKFTWPNKETPELYRPSRTGKYRFKIKCADKNSEYKYGKTSYSSNFMLK